MRKKLGCGATMFLTTAFDGSNRPHDLKCEIGKSGGCLSSFTEGISRIVSICLQYNIPVFEIVDQLENIRCAEPLIKPGENVLSCCDVIAQKLSETLEGKEKSNDGLCPECPDCGSKLIFISGCIECPKCLFKKCS